MSHPLLPKNKNKDNALFRQGRPDFSKLQVDAFPIPTVEEQGSILENTDTGDRYIWTSTIWVPIANKGANRVFGTNSLLNLGMGNVPGETPEFIVGVSAPGTNGVEALVWDEVGLRTHQTVAANIFVSSTNAADTTSLIIINALDENYEPIILSAILNGQNQVQAINVLGGGSSNTPIWVQSARVFTATPLGNVYIALTDTLTAGVPNTAAAVQSKIIAPDNVTHNGFYMVPAGKAAVFMSIRANSDSTTKTATVISVIGPFGEPVLRPNKYTVTPNSPAIPIPLPFASTNVLGVNVAAFPEKTYFAYHDIPNANNAVTTIGVDLIIVDADLIGIQP